MKKLYDFLEGIEFKLIHGSISKDISIISYDTRKISKDSIFVAISGITFNGHDFIITAIENGASVIIQEEDNSYFEDYPEVTFIQTENTRKALAIISNNYYGKPAEHLKMIGITGTNGKTTTTFLIKNLFESIGKKAAIIGTTGIYFGDEIILATHTTPESLELFEILNNLKEKGAKWVIMEVSSHSLVQHRVYGINFQTAIFTNLTQDHLDYHNTMHEYAQAKKIMFDNLSKKSTAIIYDNSEWSKMMAQDCKSENIIMVGRNDFDNGYIYDEICTLHSTEFKLNYKEQIYHIKSKLIGRFNIENLANAFLSLISLGYNPEEIIKHLENAEGAPGRMTTINLRNGAIGIIDYSHTPDALEKALSTCREIIDNFGSQGKLISVFGCGGNRDKTKRPIMGKISSEIADISIVTNDNPRNENPSDIANDILKGIDSEFSANVHLVLDRAEAIKQAFKNSENGDIILVAGKGHEDYQIIGSEKLHFDDREELEKYI